MANGGAAYQKLKGTGDQFSQASQYWGKMAQQKNMQDDRLNYAKKEAEQKRVDKKRENFDQGKKDFDFDYSGVSSVDDIVYDYSENASEMYADIGDQLEEATRSGNTKEVRRLSSLGDKVKRGFRAFKGEVGLIADEQASRKKMYAEGKISDADRRFESITEAIEDNNIRVKLDDKGNRIFVAKVDDNDTEKEIEFTMKDYLDGDLRPIQKNVIMGKNGMIDSFLVTQGKREVVSEEGDTVVVSTEWDAQNEATTQGWIKTVVDNDRMMADLYYQISGDKTPKYKDFTKEEKDIVGNYLYDAATAGFPGKRSEKTNWDKMNYGLRLRNQKLAEDRLGLAKEVADTNKKAKEASKGTYIQAKLAEDTTGEAPGGGDIQVYSLVGPKGKEIKGIMENDPDLIIKSVEVVDGEVYGSMVKAGSMTIGTASKDGESTRATVYAPERRKLAPEEVTRLKMQLDPESDLYKQIGDAKEKEFNLDEWYSETFPENG